MFVDMLGEQALDDLKRRGAGVPAPAAIAEFYRQAYLEFGPMCLWSRTPGAAPTIAQTLVVADALRREGNLAARALAETIERACSAAF